ncbi:helix-turn-helix transcriptional regulator [Phaeospirillum tilakii]|uniref:Helix-turn-helix transcriptional regulator n=1 Tax=Phaeospirillum tilakii TaxID=741673 RepID=A0ABW5C758_9PROT
MAEKLIRIKDVVSQTGLGRSTVYKLIGEGLFPSPLHPVGRASAWPESEVQRWIAARIAARPVTGQEG